MQKHTACLAILAACLAGCREGDVINLNKAKTGDANQQATNPPIAIESEEGSSVRGANARVPLDLGGGDAIFITAVQDINTETNSAALGFTAPLVRKGAAFAFSSTKPLTAEDFTRIEFLLPFAAPFNERLAIMFKIPTTSGKSILGVVPLAFMKLDPRALVLTLQARGLGIYQAVETPAVLNTPLVTGELEEQETPPPAMTPPNLTLVSNVDATGDTRSAFVNGNFAFLVGQFGIMSVDISNFATPNVRAAMGPSNLVNFGPAVGVTLNATKAFILDQNRVHRVNMQNPAQIRALDFENSTNVGGTPADIANVGNFLLVCHSNGISVLNNNLNNQANNLPATTAYGLAANDTHTFAVGEFGVLMIDSSQLPQTDGTIIDSQPAKAVAVEGPYVYAVGATGLRVYDTSNPAAPVMISTLKDIPASRTIAVKGNLAYLGGDNGLALVGLLDRSKPFVLPAAGLPQLTGISKIVITGDKALITTAAKGLVIFGDLP